MTVTITTNVSISGNRVHNVLPFFGVPMTFLTHRGMLQATPPPSKDQIHSLLPSWVLQEDILRCGEMAESRIGTAQWVHIQTLIHAV